MDDNPQIKQQAQTMQPLPPATSAASGQRIVEPPQSNAAGTVPIGREIPPSVAVNKELPPEPISMPAEQPRELMKESAGEVIIPEELDHIVEAAPDTEKPVLTQEDKNAGAIASGTAVPVPVTQVQPGILPMTYEEAVLKKKNSKIGDAIKWFAEIVILQWKKINPNGDKLQ